MENATTAEALLGMLTLGPMSGYDLKQNIEQSIGNFWQESYGQIYPTLKRLEKQGLIKSTAEGKAGRMVYSIEKPGRERLQAWLAVAPRPRVPRNELLLKLFFGRIAPVETMRSHVLAVGARFAADLVRYENTRTSLHTLHAAAPGLPFYEVTLSYGMREAQMIVDWCNETMMVLDAMLDPTPVRPKVKRR